jgi:hypothetical protein
MTPTPTALGPVSQTIESELRSWVAKHGIVLWLDVDAHYTDLAQRLSDARDHDALPYDVVGFRGSHLELLLRLETLTGGVLKKPVVVHLPGFVEADVRQTPLLELYLAGVRFRRSLDTAVTEAAAGRVRPEQIDAFKAQESLSLARADAWLHGLLSDAEGGLAAQLRHTSLPAILDDLLGGHSIAAQLVTDAARQHLHDHLAVACGLSESWCAGLLPGGAATPKDIAFVAAAWALSVEYVDDLQRPPINARIATAKDLPRALIDACRNLAEHLRTRHPEFYQRTADETEALLDDERRDAKASDLGKIDTFRFEEEKVLQAALVALAEQDWSTAADWARLRLDGGSFWLRDNPARDSAWQLVRAAAALGQAIVAAGPDLHAEDLPGAIARYTAAGSSVDRAHRHLEQRRLALLYPLLPEFESLRARLDSLRDVWRAWADAWSIAFNRLCRQEGFLPAAAMQQRTLFDDVVVPLCQEPGITAYFVVDAFRYEMGEELYRSLASTPAAHAQLGARLAELPTVTEVGMNVLAPVSRNGRLRPSMTPSRIQGFSTGEFRVSDPETRQRAKRERVGGNACPWLTLEEVVARDNTSLRNTLTQAKLIVVHSQEIDNAGEKGVGPAVFDNVMQKLRAAWRLLRDAGVRRFVFTADHGFLLLDERTPNAQARGRKIDPKRRHTFSTVAADREGEARVALADLGYEGVDGQHVIFPETTAVFDTGRRSMSFVHGGNSLQERVIPVLTVVHRAAAGASTVSYRVAAEGREPVAGMHCFSARVELAAQTTLDFAGAKEVELALRVQDARDATLEVCQVRGAARLERGSLVAAVGDEFEVFFRLLGPTESRALVEVFHPSATAEVKPCIIERRFEITLVRGAQPLATKLPPGVAATPVSTSRDWLTRLPDDGARQVFEHLAQHGAVTEQEAAAMLGSQRRLRRFALKFEELAALAPFAVRIQSVAGVKRYVREGNDA